MEASTVIPIGNCNRYLINQMSVLITMNLQEILWHITAAKKMQDYSSSPSAEMKSQVQIFLYKIQFHKYKNEINKASNYLWHKFLALARSSILT